MKQSILLLIFLLFNHILAGQNKTILKGLVTSEAGEPEDFVVISLLNATDSTIADYQFSDKDGRFTFDVLNEKGGILILSFSKLGYKKKIESLKFTHGVTNDIGIIKLRPERYVFNEVVINEKAPKVVEKTDTTIYSAAQYADGTEKKVEDILKKIPGITIDQNGRIKYQNKNIDRVLIEGDDLMGLDYTIGTKNISSKVVHKVEVIDHYLDNPLLKEIVNSDKLVINIKVGENFKNSISGGTEVGLGGFSESKYYGSGNLISLFKKSKTLFTVNSNNIRSQSMANVEYYFDSYTSAFTNENQENEKLTVFTRNKSLNTLNLPEVFTTRGVQSLGSFNHIFRIKNGIKITVSALGGVKNKYNFSEDIYTFFIPNDTLRYSDKINFSDKEIPAKFKIQSEYISLDQGYSLRTMTTGFVHEQQYLFDMTRNDTVELVNRLQMRPKGIYNYAEFTKRIHGGLFQLIGEQSSSTQKESSLIVNPILQTGIFAPINKSKISQTFPASKSYYKIAGRVMFRNKIHTDFDFGYQFKNIKLSSQLNQENELLNQYSNTIFRKEHILFTQLMLSKYFRNVDINFTVLSSLHFVGLQNNTQQPSSVFNLVSPSLSLGVHLGKQWNIRLRGSIQQTLTDISKMTINPLFVDYQTQFEGNPNILKTQKTKAELVLRKKDSLKGYYFIASAYHSITSNEYGYSTDFTKNLFTETIFNPATYSTLGANANGMYIIDFIKSRVEVSLMASKTESINKINGITRNISSDNYAYILKYGTAFKKINIRLAYNYDLFFINNTQNTSQIKYSTNNVEMTLNIKASEIFFADVKANYLNIKSLSKNSYVGFEAGLHFSPQKKMKNSKFELSVVNPFNITRFSTNYTTDFSFYTNNIKAIQRFIIFTWNTSF